MRCNNDCWSCQKDGCPYTLTVSSELDIEITKKSLDATEKARRNYLKSEKGKQALKRYALSEKGKATQERYAKSDKGRESNRRACKNYYLKHREEILSKRRAVIV